MISTYSKLKIAVFILLVICRISVFAESKNILDLSKQSEMQKLAEELKLAEGNLDLVIQKTEKEIPFLLEYKTEYNKVNTYYWGDRTRYWHSIDKYLYSEVQSEGEKRQREQVFFNAKGYASQVYITEQILEGKKEDILKMYYLNDAKIGQFEELLGMSRNNKELMWEKYKEILISKLPQVKKRANLWREKFTFITDPVWKQAKEDAELEYNMHIYEFAIGTLTPPEVRLAEDKVKKIKQRMSKIWPEWNSFIKEVEKKAMEVAENAIAEEFDFKQSVNVKAGVMHKTTETHVASKQQIAEEPNVTAIACQNENKGHLNIKLIMILALAILMSGIMVIKIYLK